MSDVWAAHPLQPIHQTSTHQEIPLTIDIVILKLLHFTGYQSHNFRHGFLCVESSILIHKNTGRIECNVGDRTNLLLCTSEVCVPSLECAMLVRYVTLPHCNVTNQCVPPLECAMLVRYVTLPHCNVTNQCVPPLECAMLVRYVTLPHCNVTHQCVPPLECAMLVR